MPDDDSLLAQGTVYFRNEGRMAANDRSTQGRYMKDEVTVTLTRRQATALADLVANTYRIMNFSLRDGSSLAYLSNEEMKDLHDRMEQERG